MSLSQMCKVGVAALLVVGGGLLSPMPAQAAVGCTGASCQGKDPNAMGCDADAVTRGEFTTDTIRIELRYSRNCFAGWVRATAVKKGYVNYPEVVSYATSTTSTEKEQP